MEDIYHYTTIQTLALILKSKKLRFTRLDLVDDIEETCYVKPESLSTHFFVSCLTKDNKESILFWNMYAKVNGVRLKKNKALMDLGIYKNNLDSQLIYPILNNESIHAKDQMSINDRFRDWIYHPLGQYDQFPFYKVYYKSNEVVKSLKENAFSKKGISMKDLLTLKTNYWKFQKEVRMIIQLDPKVAIDDIKDVENYQNLNENEKFNLYVKEILPYISCHKNYLDVRLSDEFFNDLEITLGPAVSDAEKIMIESLINEYAPNAKLNDSELKGKIRFKSQ